MATLLLLPLTIALQTGTATSQSVSNDQTQAGAVTASQELDVVANSSDTTATTTATGNSVAASPPAGSLDVESSQTTTGNVAATTVINVAADAGPTTTSLTTATGNAGSAAISGGGLLSGNFLQTTGSASVTGESQINAANAQTGDASLLVQAIGNSQQLGASDSSIAANVSQTSTATAEADGGVILGETTGQASFTAQGAGNLVSSTGGGSSSQALTVSQSNTGPVTQGAIFVNLGASQNASTEADATGNGVNVTNSGGDLAVNVSQNSDSFIHAEAVETSFAYGSTTVSANGVGNSTIAENSGPGLALTNQQMTSPEGVQVSASFQGDNGQDVLVAANAAGNTVTGIGGAGGPLSATNTQTNLGDVAATSQIGLTTSGRSVRGTASAVGNAATFYTSSP
jgi:hypothetical protein